MLHIFYSGTDNIQCPSSLTCFLYSISYLIIAHVTYVIEEDL